MLNFRIKQHITAIFRLNPQSMRIYKGMKIHFIGICGASMQALADFARARGNTVTGSDVELFGHDAENVKGCDLVVYTSAVPADNVELVAAKKRGIPTVERAEFLGRISRTFGNVIAVAGCHGKSTATAMLGKIFDDATLHVGVAKASRTGSRRLLITEACEYRESFLHLSPDLSIILNIKYDHPDFYRDLDSLARAYRRFAARSDTVLVNGDDELCARLGARFTFGTGKSCMFRAEDIADSADGCAFTFCTDKIKKRVELSVSGEHNAMNALAALSAAKIAGADLDESIEKLKDFTGLPRRFQKLGCAFGKDVYTDYAHHPDEINATLKTARALYGSIAVVFQPHTYSRTASLEDRFADALAAADAVVFAPVFAARETPIFGVSSHSVCRKLVDMGKDAYCFDTFGEINEYCEKLPQDAIIFMGAGNIDLAAKQFVENGTYV